MDARDGTYLSKSMQYELSEDAGRNASDNPTFGDIVNARFGRRDMLRGGLGVAAMTALAIPAMSLLTSKAAKAAVGGFGFEEIEAGVDETHHVAAGHTAQVLIRWGDPVVAGAPAFDPENQTAAAQEMQFGYNSDYVGYVPLPRGSETADHGLLVVNHEYVNSELMFPGLANAEGEYDLADLTPEQIAIEMAAHGLSVVEVRKEGDGWAVVPDSRYGRRITALSTMMTVSGPAAGHDRLKTSADPEGRNVIGTFNNCAGGTTPWGTILTAEENFHGYFAGTLPEGHRETENYARYGAPDGSYAWSREHARFDVGQEPNEPNRYGWMVEVDPYDPNSVPVKRTALGRFKHEGAESIMNGDGRVVVYMGDDERFDYLYKYVSDGRVDLENPASNGALLDEGTLFVARFDEDGTMEWMPLVHGQGPLTAENGFEAQADVAIETRRAADLLGATKMDRPEDVEPNPTNGRVYLMLTNNTRREAGQENAVNPRPDNAYGHIVEIVTPDGDHAATSATWEILVKCGDPDNPDHGAAWHSDISANGWFGSPDNCAIDPQGRLWISTDGNDFEYSGRTDGLWAMETEGERRGFSKLFFRVPVGAEMCGPKFTPDGKALFLAVQHPADGGSEWPGFGRPSTYADPSTRWPDFDPDMPVRPSVVVVTRDDGGAIG
ncbi:PhoX family phosphatase [Inquilinus sp. CAU 1745]|uniref:PhoX family protein n=1 Tax=Inquilinus sp. CAU 1745 TaxID=3140369 RepID=UPI00325B9326